MKAPVYTLALALIAVAVVVVKWPNQMYFSAYAAGDQGGNLAAYQLTEDGWRPGVDFTYLYGLLSLLAGRVTFGVFGCTPLVYAGVTSLLAIGVAVALARVAVITEATLAGRVFLAAALPLAVDQLPQLNFAHALEGFFLTLAVASHARGRLGWALAAVTLAVAAKPALGYVYGLALVAQILLDAGGPAPRWRGVALRLLPAVATAAAVFGLLAGVYGVEAVGGSLLPSGARQVYAREGFGFFSGSGRQFWAPDGANVRYYLGTPVGVWLAATGGLTAFAVWRIARRVGGRRWTPADRVALTCCGLHLTFVTCGFGNHSSWTYYMPLLLAGLVACVGRRVRVVTWALVPLAVVAHYSEARWVASLWTDRHPTEATGGLYATRAEADEWERVRTLGQSRRVFVLTQLGAARQLTPEVDSPRAWSFYAWMPTPRESADLIERIRSADVIVLTRKAETLANPSHPVHHPQVASELTAFPHRVETDSWTFLCRTADVK